MTTHGRRRRPARSRREHGYVLLATLAIVLVMTLLASTIALTTERAVEDRRQADDQLQAEIDATSTAATVFYLLSSQRQTFGGLTVDGQMVLSPDEISDQQGLSQPIGLRAVGNEIRMDSTPYLGVGGVKFALQDDRGRVNPNWQSPDYLVRFLTALKVPAEQIGPLLAKLKDYQDADDLFRLNGAEADDYRKAGMAPPTNRTLATPLELRRVLGWKQALAGLSDARLLQLISVTRNPLVNINTAGQEALQMIPGVGADTAARVIARRQQSAFDSVYDFARFAGVVMDDDQLSSLSLYPGGTGTLDVWSDQLGYQRQFHWSLSPLDDGGRPWRSEYSFALPLPENPNGVIAEKPGAKVFDNALPAR